MVELRHPREIAPRLHDAFVAIYRGAGFEPRVRTESFHTGWDLGVLAEVPAAAMAPQTVAGGLPDGIVAVVLSEPTDSLETCLIWRNDDSSRAVAAFVGGRALGLRPRAGRVPVVRRPLFRQCPAAGGRGRSLELRSLSTRRWPTLTGRP
jgi:hypothetical protein